jgi:putative methyltransferase (TIGR04325 family)
LSAKDLIIDVLSSQPFARILQVLDGIPHGRKVLNACSFSRGIYDSFGQAWEVANKKSRAGHNHADAITLHLELAKHLRSSDYAVLYWLGCLAKTRLKLFDFGGNAGNLYYSYSSYLSTQFQQLEWTVFDLPNVIEQGRKIATERNARELRFTDSLQDASLCDVVLVSGAFHYWEKRVEEFIDQFNQRPRNIILNRTPAHVTKPTFLTVQCTKSYAVPCIVRNADEIISGFAARGYVLADRWAALELALRFPLFPDYSVQHYSGFCFRYHPITSPSS